MLRKSALLLCLTAMLLACLCAASAEPADCFEYTIADGEVTITGYTGDAAVLVIPGELGGGVVTTIGSFAFSFHDELQSVTLPSTLTQIGMFGFGFCSSLTEIDLPDSLTGIDMFAFNQCALSSIRLPAALRLPDYPVFSLCPLAEISVDDANPFYTVVDGVLYSTDLSTLVLYPAAHSMNGFSFPQTVSAIAPGAFACCSMQRLPLPDTVTSIGMYAFSSCAALQRIEIPSGVTAITECAFENCSSLSEVLIPDTVSRIDFGAFMNCTSLKNLFIPESVASIAEQVFDGVSLEMVTVVPGSFAESWCLENDIPCSLYFAEQVILPSSLTVIDSQAFANTPAIACVVIPASVTEIADDAFPNHPFFQVVKGSYGETWCLEHNESYFCAE